MRKTLSIVILFVLCGCGTLTKQEFLQDEENVKKQLELSNKAVASGCDKIVELNNFVGLRNPTSDDLAEIIHIFGLNKNDATDIDKIYGIDTSIIKTYSCTDISEEKYQYCLKKYGGFFDIFKENQCLTQVYQDLPPCEASDKYDHIFYYYEGKDLAQEVKNKIKQIYPLPKSEYTEVFLLEFTPNELITANNTILGKYDGDYCYNRYGDFCDENTKNVTILNAINVLYNFCSNEHYGNVGKECVCFAHETYKKVNYQNILYIYEKGELPYSKKNEFNNLFMKCEQKIEKQRIKAEKERYGEAENTDNTGEAMGNFIAETLENMSYLHKMATESRKRAEKTNNR